MPAMGGRHVEFKACAGRTFRGAAAQSCVGDDSMKLESEARELDERQLVIAAIQRIAAATVGAAALVAAAVVLTPSLARAQGAEANRVRQPLIVSRSSNIIEQQGLRFKDLNRNGALDPYEDWRLPPSARAKDLVSRMTLEEKAGMMMHGTARSAGPGGAIGFGSGYDTGAIGQLIRGRRGHSLL